MSSRVAPVGLLLTSQVSVQFGAAVAAALFDRVGPGGAVTLRLGLSGVALLLVCRPRLRGRTRADLLVALAYGLALGGMNLCFYEAISRIPLGAAVTLEVLGPLTLSVLTGRGRLRWLWAALALAGVALLGLDGVGALPPVGVLFALAAGALWACYILLAQRAGRSYARLDGLALGLGVATLLVAPAGIASAGVDLLDPGALALGAAVALLSSLLPYSLEMRSLRAVPAAVFAVVMSLSPAIAALAGAVVLGQPLGPVGALAIALVVAANVGAVGRGLRTSGEDAGHVPAAATTAPHPTRPRRRLRGVPRVLD
ncbi:EamA family transporter [Pseudonocardia xishanensis]|uniref:EamA family transporter n=1 Tax=Pseudonocardia xishanensis TaxID=630995 RepID=UPI0031EBFEB2